MPFLPSFAEGLIRRHGTPGEPEALADVIVLLPTRRAIAGLADAFLGRLELDGKGALVLPRMMALGDPEEDAIDAGAWGLVGNLPENAILPPAMPQIRRTMLLARLTQTLLRQDDPEASFGVALSWAESLGALLDEAAIEGADLARIADAIPEELATHWQVSRRFLALIAEAWPRILSEHGEMSAIERRNQLLVRQAQIWKRSPPGPVYVAGSTGSQPATARLMAEVCTLPEGTVVLPGLDMNCPSEVWEAVTPGHPQWGLKDWLERTGLRRGDVRIWPAVNGDKSGRVRLISEALRPAPTTDSWAKGLEGVDLVRAAEGLRICEVDSQAEEARVIALLMREVLDRPARTAALVTPDRSLARRVATELTRWDIQVDDSAGVPLDQTPVWIFLSLILTVAREAFAPVPSLALLKSPHAACGGSVQEREALVDLLERLCLRGPRPRPGIEGLRHRLRSVLARIAESGGTQPPGARRLNGLFDRLESVFRPLTDLIEARGADGPAWAQAHIAVAEAMSTASGEGGGETLWSGPDGEAAASIIASITETDGLSSITCEDYIQLFLSLARGRAVRPFANRHPRLAIWGPLEARLQSADLVILGSLTEETWPRRPDTGPWVNLLMRKAAGLSDPERFVGLSAHDFQELAAASNVVLTVPARVGGQPALPSRWVQRLQNYLKGQGLADAVKLAPQYREWAVDLDRPQVGLETPKPEPRPPVSARPRSMSVTEVETLLRDPYAIFAKHVLGIRKLDPVDEQLGPRHLGTVLHKIMELYVAESGDMLGAHEVKRLLRIGEACIAAETDDRFERAIWLSRITRAAESLIAWEREHRAEFRPHKLEVRGALHLEVPAGRMTLRARADRIDLSADGSRLAILDYKTGQLPSLKQIKAGLKPQLSLEALMAERGAFEEIPPIPVSTLIYLKVGGREGIEERIIVKGLNEIVEEAAAGFTALIEKFDHPDTPYLSWPIPERMEFAGDYDLLSRVKVWGGAIEPGT